MSTKGIIDRVIPWCPGWERHSGKKNLLKVLEQGLDRLFSWDHECMIYRGTDNQGFPPYLITTKNIYDYAITASNLSCGPIVRNVGGTEYPLIAKKVNKVFIDVSKSSYESSHWLGHPYYSNLSPYGSDVTRQYFVDIKIASQPAYEDTPPTIKFLNDPGDTTDTFFIEFFIGPPRLTSESIQTPVPAEFEQDLENYIIGFVQWRENGRINDYMQYFENVTIPKFQSMMSSCANPVSTKIVPNYF